jgi:hypothetical protein
MVELGIHPATERAGLVTLHLQQARRSSIPTSEFGPLHNADLQQRLHTRTGPPTPDDLNELLFTAREPDYFLAHPRAIAALL